LTPGLKLFSFCRDAGVFANGRYEFINISFKCHKDLRSRPSAPESSCTRWACAAGPPRSLHLVKHLEQGIDALYLRLCPQVQGVISLLSGLYPTQN